MTNVDQVGGKLVEKNLSRGNICALIISNLHKGVPKSEEFIKFGEFVNKLVVLVHQEHLKFGQNRNQKMVG